MSITGKSLSLMFGFAAGTALVMLANKRTGNKVKKLATGNRGAGFSYGVKSNRHLYDDSGIYYV